MSQAAVTFRIFGRTCVVVLPPSLEVPPANDVDRGAPDDAQPAQDAGSRAMPLGALRSIAEGRAGSP
jgi:hypothetical protein